MPKYRNAYRTELDDDTTYSEDVAAEQGTANDNGEPASGGNDPFEKRYADLRRHSQRKEQQLQEELRVAREQLAEASKKQLKFPKTDDEIKAWVSKYPDVAAIVETIARKQAMDVGKDAERQIKELREAESQLRQREAAAELARLQPDFFDVIRHEEAFHSWLEEQPQFAQDAIYSGTDPRSASRVIDLYKADTGRAKGKKTDPRDAAQAIQRGSSSTPGTGSKAKWSESRIAKLSDAEFEKYEAEIMEASRNGTLVMDVTGAAR